MEEYLSDRDSSCNGTVGLTMRYEGTFSDNGSRVQVEDGSDNVTASSIEIDFQEAHLSFNDLRYIDGLKADNETYLCGESYWTGVERDVTSCGFHWMAKDGNLWKAVTHVTENNTLKIGWSTDSVPTWFGCNEYSLESEGIYPYPI